MTAFEGETNTEPSQLSRHSGAVDDASSALSLSIGSMVNGEDAMQPQQQQDGDSGIEILDVDLSSGCCLRFDRLHGSLCHLLLSLFCKVVQGFLQGLRFVLQISSNPLSDQNTTCFS